MQSNTNQQPVSPLARSILDAAVEVEAAETRIKQELLRAAQAGDTDRVINIVKRWTTCPAAEVLAPPSP